MNSSVIPLLKSKITQCYTEDVDPSDVFKDLNIIEPHKGVFIVWLNGRDVVCEDGELQSESKNLTQTVINICKNKKSTVDVNNTLLLYIVKDVILLKNKLDWELNKDGIYFQWGDRFKGMFLPHEMAKYPGDKIRMLDRLCSHKLEIPSSLWRYPEGIVFSLKLLKL